MVLQCRLVDCIYTIDEMGKGKQHISSFKGHIYTQSPSVSLAYTNSQNITITHPLAPPRGPLMGTAPPHVAGVETRRSDWFPGAIRRVNQVRAWPA
jgi:hypothetical protein